MSGGTDDVWSVRRRLGRTLRRWASSERALPRVGIADDPPERRERGRTAAAGADHEAGRRCARRTRRGSRDRGAASIFVLAVGLVLIAGGVALAGVGSARIGRHQAQVAADLGALAGAARAIEGQEPACARARQFVAANRGRMTFCRVDRLEIVVHTDVAVTPLPGMSRHAQAAARAGPVYTVPF
jgi:secretion/DNA translocation related TadE-like protein